MLGKEKEQLTLSHVWHWQQILRAANRPANCLSTDTQRWRAHHTDPRTNFNEDERIFFSSFSSISINFCNPLALSGKPGAGNHKSDRFV